MIINAIKRKRQEIIRSRRKRKIANIAKYSLPCLVIGVVCGLLLAPKSGKETILKIKSDIGNTKENLENKSKKMLKSVESSIEDKKAKIAESKRRIKEYFSKNNDLIEIKTSFIKEPDEIEKSNSEFADKSELKDNK
ncbi:YtxH domain-containing protein [Peptostreptococcus sp. D1]|uniref:YtxH domain-containing protein n=1 Tax=Peptostreptococcus sp. D1 TaxID=72304 RepID=UPI0008E6E480|nr:YtxH domain-containing protein [Peptostreptococcus sp. D1]SFE20469.1 YtxH-like protein [Peptostreptococcus sp. D1]